MSITVNHIISTDIFKANGKLVAGSDGLNKSVQSVTVMEVKDFTKHSIDENLFILTTFSNSANKPDLMEKTFTELIGKKISGMAIKINRYLKAIPDILISLADKNNIPLIVLNETILFSKVILCISSLIINSQYETIRTIKEQYEIMNLLILKGKKLYSLIEHIGQYLNTSCYCYTSDGNLIAQYINNRSEDAASLKLNNILALSMKKQQEYYLTEDNKYFVFYCMSNNNVLGYFVLKNNYSFCEKEIMLARQYTNFITIKLMADLIIDNEKVNSRRHTVNKLFFDSSISEKDVRECLKILGIEPKDSYHILVVRNAYPTSSIINYMQKRKIMEFFQPLTNICLLVENLYEDIVIVLLFNQVKPLNIDIILKDLHKYLSHNVNSIKLGCSQKSNCLELFSSSLEEAKEAILIGNSFSPDKDIFYFNEFIQIKLLSKLLNTKEYFLMRKKIIEPMEIYSNRKKLDLIHTLEVCLSSETLHKAAEFLYIHINSLRYRLDKIHDLTGENFFTGYGKQSLSNAVLLYKLEMIYDKDKTEI